MDLKKTNLKYILLYNPISGKGKFKNKIPKLVHLFKQRDVSLDVYESKFSKDLEQKAFEFANEYDVFIVSGGDGTINEVINGIMKSDKKPKLALIPSGTANDIASIIGASKNLNKLIKQIFETEAVKIDINQFNDKYFLYTTAAGLLTKISYDVPRKHIKRFGYLAYLHHGFKDLFNDYNLSLNIKTKDEEVKGNFMMFLGLTAKRVGGFNLPKFSNAKINDGLLEVRLIKHQRFFKLSKLMSFFMVLGWKQRKDYQLSSNEYYISSDYEQNWNIDGEKIVAKNIHLKVHQEAIEVFLSAKAKKKYILNKN